MRSLAERHSAQCQPRLELQGKHYLEVHDMTYNIKAVCLTGTRTSTRLLASVVTAVEFSLGWNRSICILASNHAASDSTVPSRLPIRTPSAIKSWNDFQLALACVGQSDARVSLELGRLLVAGAQLVPHRSESAIGGLHCPLFWLQPVAHGTTPPTESQSHSCTTYVDDERRRDEELDDARRRDDELVDDDELDDERRRDEVVGGGGGDDERRRDDEDDELDERRRVELELCISRREEERCISL